MKEEEGFTRDKRDRVARVSRGHVICLWSENYSNRFFFFNEFNPILLDKLVLIKVIKSGPIFLS